MAELAEPRGARVTVTEEKLFRQVHPVNVQEGRLTRVAFEVKDSDAGLLSIALESKTTAQAAYEHYTGVRKLKSCGVYAVTVQECDSEGLPAWEDPEENPFPDPAHGVIDFRPYVASKAEKKKREAVLARYADARGPVFKP